MTMSLNPEVNPPPHVGQISVDATLLAKRLSTCKEGDSVTYVEMSAIIGRDVTGEARYVLTTARNILRREQRMVFGIVRKVGVRRLNNDEIADSCHAPIQRIRHIADKAGRVIACADSEKLAPEKQRAISVALSVTGAISLFASSKSFGKALAVAKATAIPEKIDVSAMAELFSKKD